MKKATLAAEFAEERAKSGMTMLGIANRCDISEATVWKVENGKSVRWETVHLILTLGLKIPAGTPRYAAFQALWVRQRQEMAESQAADFGVNQLSPPAQAAVRKFRELVRDMDAARIKRLMATVTRSVRR